MPDFLSRPVFEFAIDWLRTPQTSFDYDLRALTVGFGGPVFRPLQEHVARGYQASVWLRDEDELQDFDDFFTALTGRVQGFWLKEPRQAFEIAAGVDAARFDIEDQQLAEVWDEHPAVYLQFEKDGETNVRAAITDVTDNGDGTERVTIDAALTIDETWTPYPIVYVRLADSKISGQFDAENRLTVGLKFVELPTEYAGAELGSRPVYLYEIMGTFGGTAIYWRFTSYWQTVNALGNDFTPFPIDHSGFTRTTKGDAESLTLETVADAASPLQLFIPFTLPVPLNVTIYKATLDNLAGVAIFFVGQIQAAAPGSGKFTAKVSSILDLMSRRVLRFVLQPRCNYQVFEPNTCKLDRADFEVTATIDSITGRTLVVSDPSLNGVATDYFSEGWIEVGADGDFEIRTIIKDEATDTEEHTLTLNFPLNHAAILDTITMLPGCDRLHATCINKFNNLTHFGGHPFIPNRNLTLQAVTPSPGGGGKKG